MNPSTHKTICIV
jgi:SAM-dependent methyltransferase